MPKRLIPMLAVLPIVFALLAGLSSCARLNSIHRSDPLGTDGKVIYTDAKQRALVATKAIPGADKKHWQFCIEPSPDVFSALAASLATEANLDRSGTPASKTASLQLSTAITENASTIERSQTIGMLREMMYRTCERYISGATGQAEFIVQAARDQRAMVAILAIEQLTGVQKAQATAITTTASSMIGGPTEKTLIALDKAFGDKNNKEKLALEARKLEQADTPTTSCETAVAATEESSKKTLCLAAEKAQAESQAADKHYQALLKGVSSQGELVASTQGQHHSELLQASAANEKIANTVAAIVNQVDNFNEIEMTCVVFLRQLSDLITSNNSSKTTKAGSLTNANAKANAFASACLELVNMQTAKQQSEAKLAKLRADEESAKTEKRLEFFRNRDNSNAAIVWQLLLDKTPTQRSTILNSLTKAANVTINPRQLNNLKNAKNLEEFKRLYSQIPGSEEKSRLSAAASAALAATD